MFKSKLSFPNSNFIFEGFPKISIIFLNEILSIPLIPNVLFKIMEIVEQNGLSFAFPSQSVYIENIPEIASECVKSKVNSNDKGEQNG